MKNIVHVQKVMSLYEPDFHFITHNGPVDDIFYYMYVQIVYDVLNRVQYTTLEHISKSQSCSTIQFHEGYHTGGNIKHLIMYVFSYEQINNINSLSKKL